MPATKQAPKKAGLRDLDIVESNEAFAAQACAVTTKPIYEPHRTGGRHALATMCIGGGQGRDLRAHLNWVGLKLDLP